MNLVLFLDVDGVLNQVDEYYLHTPPQEHQEAPFCTDPELVTKLNSWLLNMNLVENETTVLVVVSSTWRLHFEDAWAFEECTGVLEPFIHRDWCTDTVLDRGDQILMWLHEHPETDNFVILDDNDYNFPQFPKLIDRFVKTDERTGLTDENLFRACAIIFGRN
jgi:Swiss Army Knife RNA repair-like protein